MRRNSATLPAPHVFLLIAFALILCQLPSLCDAEEEGPPCVGQPVISSCALYDDRHACNLIDHCGWSSGDESCYVWDARACFNFRTQEECHLISGCHWEGAKRAKGWYFGIIVGVVVGVFLIAAVTVSLIHVQTRRSSTPSAPANEKKKPTKANRYPDIEADEFSRTTLDTRTTLGSA